MKVVKALATFSSQTKVKLPTTAQSSFTSIYMTGIWHATESCK